MSWLIQTDIASEIWNLRLKLHLLQHLDYKIVFWNYLRLRRDWLLAGIIGTTSIPPLKPKLFSARFNSCNERQSKISLKSSVNGYRFAIYFNKKATEENPCKNESMSACIKRWKLSIYFENSVYILTVSWHLELTRDRTICAISSSFKAHPFRDSVMRSLLSASISTNSENYNY